MKSLEMDHLTVEIMHNLYVAIPSFGELSIVILSIE